jgi:hypothetical protein
MEQIAGRIRINENFQNVFRNVLVHIFTTNKKIMSDEEFWGLIDEKEQEAKELLSSQNDMKKGSPKVWIKHMNLESTLLSEKDGRLVYNEQKRQSFIFKHNLRKAYKDGIHLRMQFEKSEKFVPENQQLIDDFDIIMNKALTVSYEQLLKDYLDHPSEQYEIEYPEFKDFRLYLKETEMNSLRWNKDKMLSVVEDRKKLQQAFRAIYQRGAFISNEEMKRLLTEQFNRLGIKLSPKSTQILNCDIYHVERRCHYINKKRVDGYELGDMLFNF